MNGQRPADEIDLKTLCKPWGLLHPDTKASMNAWQHGVEGFTGEYWLVHEGIGRNSYMAYRAKPDPLETRATIPWEFLRSEFQFVAMDDDGDWYGYTDNVVQRRTTWSGDDAISLNALTFPQGNQHWTKTLQTRPRIQEE